MEMSTELKLKKVRTCSGCLALSLIHIANRSPDGPKFKHSCKLGYVTTLMGSIVEPAVSKCPKPLNTNELAGVIAIMNMVGGDYQVEMNVATPEKLTRHASEVRVIVCDCAHNSVCKMQSDMSELRWRLAQVAHGDWPCEDIGQTVQVIIQCSYRVERPDVPDDEPDIN